MYKKEMQTREIILGIDPGSRITGYALLEIVQARQFVVIDYGTISPPKTLSLMQRYKIIFRSVEALLEKHTPSSVAIEGQFIHQKFPQTALFIGMAAAAAFLPPLLRDIPLTSYAPSRVKRAVVGSGRASKEQIQAMTQKLLNLHKRPPADAADALALAMCHAHNQGL